MPARSLPCALVRLLSLIVLVLVVVLGITSTGFEAFLASLGAEKISRIHHETVAMFLPGASFRLRQRLEEWDGRLARLLCPADDGRDAHPTLARSPSIAHLPITRRGSLCCRPAIARGH